ncbi:MAG: reverse transcriptase family protein, partial [Candidatus Thiodiazotropha sp.]
DENYLNETITLYEIQTAIHRLKDKKAAGIDEIPSEVLKTQNLLVVMGTLFNQCFALGKIPDMWKCGIITPVIKSSTSDYRDPSSYRGITITPAIYKLYCNILNNRLLKWESENSILSDPQNGFRKGRSTIDHVLSLTSIIDTRKLKRQSTFAAFIDFSKAYDSINRELLFRKLSDLGLNGRIYKAVTSLYDNVKCCVKINGLKTDFFEVTCGLKQGCTLSTLLFNLYVNDLVLKISSLDVGINIDEEKVAILLYADDLVLIAPSKTELQMLLNELNIWCYSNGIQINQKKSNIIHFRPTNVMQTNFNFKCGDKALELVTQYVYLGLLLTEHMDYESMAKHVAKSANRALGLVIAKSKAFGGLPFGTFTKLYDAMVWSVISYGAAIWGNRQFSCINTVQLRAARYYMGVGRYTPNAAVQGDTGWKPTIVRQWLSVINQWIRLKLMDTNRLNQKIFAWSERNANGRCKNWNQRVNTMLEEAGVIYQSDMIHPAALKSRLSEYLLDRFIVSWSEDVHRDNARQGAGKNKLRTYKTFKSVYSTESYLNCIMSRCHRSAYAKFRCGVAPIRIETGRYERLSHDLRTCFNCINSVENEQHVLLKCPLYNDLREAMFNVLSDEFPEIRNFSDLEKLSAILSCNENKSIRICAKTCFEILRTRRNIFI